MEFWQIIVMVLGFVGTIVSVGVVAFVSAKKGGTEALTLSNDLLRKTVDDQGKEIIRQRELNHERDNRMQALELTVARLQADKDGLSKIMREALVEYFKSDKKIIKAAEQFLSNGKEGRA